MKVAFLGNMNNNNFALMRYFRDLGIDAHLLLFSNDGVGCLEHFKPEDDTFNLNKWSYFIHQTKIFNGPNHVLPYIIQLVLFPLINFRNKVLGRNLRIDSLSKCELNKILDSYDKIITSGYAPAILYRIERPVSIFYPYAIGVEGVNRIYAPPYKSFLNRLIFEYARYIQIRGLKRSDNILNAEIGLTQDVLLKLGLKCRNLAIPMVYVDCDMPQDIVDDHIREICNELKECKLSVLMHSRLAWNEEICKKNALHSKNNHWVIRAFKELKRMNPKLKAKLIILEYGPDIDNTKKLIEELNLGESTLWVKKTSRKNIMWLLQSVTLACGEFIDLPKIIWGGTGWEVLASGIPLLQGFKFKEGEFEEILGYPPPPLLPVTKEADILFHFLNLCDDPCKAKSIGIGGKKWFEQYNGVSLSKKWLELLN
jgi:glycosyltransferase involved in cell wall biosynthesis